MLIECVGGGVGREGFPLCKVVELVWNPQPMGSSVLSLPWVVWTCDQVGCTAWEEGCTQEVCSKDPGGLKDIPQLHPLFSPRHPHFQMQAAGPAGWMIFKCPEPPRVNPTLSHPVAGLHSATSCIKCGFPYSGP